MGDDEAIHGGGFNMDNLQTMGIVNAMRTGDARIDMLIAMLIPLFIRLLFDFATKFEAVFTAEWWKKTWDWWNNLTEDEYERRLTYSQRSAHNNKNTLLIKAVQLYVHKVVKIDLQKAYIELLPPDEDNNYYDSDSDGEEETYADRLKKMEVLRKPKDGEWVDIGSYSEPPVPVLMRCSKEEKLNDKQEIVDVILEIKFESKSGKAIDAFVETAYEWYVAELKNAEKKNYRYFYELKTGGNNDDGDDDEYSRYRLSDEKTFDSLFFPEKENLLKMLRHFLDRTGKYAIKGYPHKLGVLLHGPPGTGKTSLIKALAHFTGRSIININLSRIKTNKHLMKIFFNKSRKVEGECYSEDDVGFKDAIFVMEDVDAASNVVKRRDGKKTVPMVKTEQVDIQPKCMFHMLLNSNDEDCKNVCQLLMEKSSRLKAEAQKPEVVRSVVGQMKALPGLTVVTDSSDDPSLKRIGREALQEADKIMDNSERVSKFLAFHSRKIKSLLESGTEVSDAIVDDLLETEVSSVIGASDPNLSRDVSWEPVHDSGAQSMFFGGPLGEMALGGSMKGLGAIGGGNKGGDTKGSDAKRGGGKGTGPDDLAGDPFSTGKTSFIGGHSFTPLLGNNDALNLSGLLNCLDGVVDSPGRLVILTSNHPEVLDPALVRPGRIDKKLLLGYMDPPEVTLMLEHYFQTELTESQKSRLKLAIEGPPRLNLTPAQIEQFTVEHDEIDDMIAALEEKSSPPLPPATKLGGTTPKLSGGVSTRSISINYDGV